MSNHTAGRRPSGLQYVAYCYGRVLPGSMRDCVEDLGGKGATIRTMIRWAIPCVVLAPFWLIPTTLVVHLSMTVPIFAPYVMFSHALDKVWRRHRLSQEVWTPISPTNTSARATRTSTARTSNATAPGE